MAAVMACARSPAVRPSRSARASAMTGSQLRSRPRPAPAVLHGLVVLVVDDHADSRLVLQQMLEAAGARVLLADHGVHALEQLETQRRPHVILCDLLMPVLDGLGLARRIQANSRWAGIPLLAVTALGGAADYIRTWEHGFAGHITKPFKTDVLIEAIRRVARAAAR
jgi:two-component system, sensor histidine kinase and response regulator